MMPWPLMLLAGVQLTLPAALVSGISALAKTAIPSMKPICPVWAVACGPAFSIVRNSGIANMAAYVLSSTTTHHKRHARTTQLSRVVVGYSDCRNSLLFRVARDFNSLD